MSFQPLSATLAHSPIWLNVKRRFIRRLALIIDSPKRGNNGGAKDESYPMITRDNPRGVLCRFGTIWDFISLDSTSETGQRVIHKLNEQIQQHPELSKDIKIFLFRVRSTILRDYLNMTRNDKMAPISVQRAIYESYTVRKYLKIQKSFEEYDIRVGLHDHRYVVDFLKRMMFKNLPDYQVKRTRKPGEIYHVNWFK